MKNAIILHSINNDHTGNWFPWLREELTKNGYKTWVPDLPQPDVPNIKLNNELILPNWEFDSDSLVIGHSSGAVAVAGLLQALPEEIHIAKAVYVSFFSEVLSDFSGHRELFLEPFNWEKIKKRANQHIIFHSDNDPYVPLWHAEKLRDHVNGELIIVKGAGHFNLESQPAYKTFPLLLQKILV